MIEFSASTFKKILAASFLLLTISTCFAQDQNERLVNSVLEYIKYDTTERDFFIEVSNSWKSKRRMFGRKDILHSSNQDSLSIYIGEASFFLPKDIFKACEYDLGNPEFYMIHSFFNFYEKKVEERFRSDSEPLLGIVLFEPIDNYVAVQIYDADKDNNGKKLLKTGPGVGRLYLLMFKVHENGRVELVCR